MNCSPTLTADEFKTIHNALWDLDCVARQLEGVLNPELYVKLAKAASDIRNGLKGAYEQDNESFEIKTCHYESVRKDLGLKSVWSAMDVDNMNDRHPFEGVTTLVYNDHWGEKPVSVKINGLTWAALYVAADAAIRDSGDEHHVFIEDFRKVGDTLVLSTGS